MIYSVTITPSIPIMSFLQVMYALDITDVSLVGMIKREELDTCIPFPSLRGYNNRTFIVHNDKLQAMFDEIDRNKKLHKRFLKAVEKTNKMMEGDI